LRLTPRDHSNGERVKEESAKNDESECERYTISSPQVEYR